MSPHRQKYFQYCGRSMWPCFQEGDLLEIEPVEFKKLHTGDCLLFPDHQGQLVVHRLVRKRNGLRSRGDATAILDLYEIMPEQIQGKVVRRHRFDRTTTVKGGWAGMLAALFYRYAGRIDPQRASRGGHLAKAIQKASTTLFRPIWRKGKVRTLSISEQGSMVVWLLGKNVIGKKNLEYDEWLIRWPWRVFVDVTKVVDTEG